MFSTCWPSWPERTWLIVEYGLQTVHDRTLDLIRRGHHFDAFMDAYLRSRQRGLNVGAHVILGLPGETREDMVQTAETLAKLDIHSIKPHNLYAVRNTELADWVSVGQVRLPEMQEYVGLVGRFLGKNTRSSGNRTSLRRRPLANIFSVRSGVSTRDRSIEPWKPSSAVAALGRGALVASG